jgi:DNA polymerase-3 subunit beta
LSILDNVLFAASNDVSRFNLNSLYFSEHNNLPCVVATDGHRLAMQYVLELPVPKLTKIPKSGCDFIKKFLSKIPAQSLKIYSDKKNVVFSTDSTTITIRIIDGDYPDVGKVVPSVEPETRILVNTDIIKQSVKRVSLITDQMHKSLDIAIVGDNIEIASNNAQLGSALDSVLVNKTGADCNFVMNSAYLIDALNHVSGESCEILLTGPGKPMIFRSENATDVFSLIMPMRK